MGAGGRASATAARGFIETTRVKREAWGLGACGGHEPLGSGLFTLPVLVPTKAPAQVAYHASTPKWQAPIAQRSILILNGTIMGQMETIPPVPLTKRREKPRRPLAVRIGKKLRRRLDAVIERSSLVPNDPVLDARAFAWTALLRERWEAIRAEALAVLRQPERVPLLDEVSPDHRRIAPPGKWRSFFLYGYGQRLDDNIARCPATAGVVAQVPALNSAFFSILAPGAYIPPHRGVTKGLLTCHLGLVVPDGPVRMRVGPETVRWADGATLVFDDTWQHEVWNDTDETRVVLLIQFGRPLRAPGRWLAGAFLWAVRRSPFVREARRNIALWDQAMRDVEQAHRLDG